LESSSSASVPKTRRRFKPSLKKAGHRKSSCRG
jgi:hypothetical protein